MHGPGNCSGLVGGGATTLAHSRSQRTKGGSVCRALLASIITMNTHNIQGGGIVPARALGQYAVGLDVFDSE